MRYSREWKKKNRPERSNLAPTQEPFSTSRRISAAFLERSKRELIASTGSHNHSLCLEIAQPDLDLLRIHPETRQIFSNKELIDRRKMVVALTDCSDPALRLQLALLSDQLKHLPDTQATAKLRDLKGMKHVMCPAQLCSLHKKVLQASYYTPLTTKNTDDLCLLFGKAVNVRCQGRMFPIVLVRILENNSSVYRSILKIVLCSLLGNYKFCRTRPIGAARGKLYSWFSQPSQLFLTLAKQCNELVVNAVREFLIYSIEAHPWLHKHLSPLMSLKQLKQIVVSSMDRVRDYFELYLSEPSSALFNCITNEEALKRVIWDLNERLFKSHEQILAISYRRPNLNPCAFVNSTRLYNPLVKIPTEAELAEQEMKEMTEEQGWDKIEQEILNAQEQPEEEEEELDEYQQALKEMQQDQEELKPKELEIWKYIKPDCYRALQAVVQREKPCETGAFSRCLDWLELFGASEESVSYTRVILKHYEYGTVSMAKLKQRFVLLRKYEPYAFTLLQLTATLIKQAERHFKWFELPLHYKQHQLQSLRSKFTNQNIVIDKSLYLVYCSVCETDYSLIRVFPNKNTGKKVYTQYYRCGFRDAVVDYETGEMFCKRDKHNIRGKCSAQPLSFFPLIGRAFLRNGKCIMICPVCGLKMEYDPQQCWFSPRGAACADCTKHRKENPDQFEQLKQQYTREEQKRNCFKCFHELKETWEIHLLPAEGVYLCKYCAKPWLIKKIEEELGEESSIEELKKFITQAWTENKQRFEHQNRERDKRQLVQYKKQQSNKRVRR